MNNAIISRRFLLPPAVRAIHHFSQTLDPISIAPFSLDLANGADYPKYLMNAPIEFETQRLLLRQWRAADRQPFAALNADPIVMAHFPAQLTREESDVVADRCERLIAERRWGTWVAEIKATGEFIGCVGLNIPRDDLPVSPCVEILWRLAQAHWRQGFASEAARGALHIGFEVLGLTEVVSFTVPSNTRSRAVMERLGMQMDAATFEHPGVPEGHVLRTHCNYRLSRDGWLLNRSDGNCRVRQSITAG